MAKTKKASTKKTTTTARNCSSSDKKPTALKSTPKSTEKAKASAKPSAKKKAAARPRKPKSPTVTVDRRLAADRRESLNRREQSKPVAVEHRKLERRAKVNRRRQIDPTTCERNYTADEIEFMNSLDDYKRVSGRMFPTCSEILEVIRKLGYEKRCPTATATSIGQTEEDKPVQPDLLPETKPAAVE